MGGDRALAFSEGLTLEIVAVNLQATLLVSGVIDDWALVRDRRVDTIVDMDGDVDAGVPEAPNEILYVYFPILDEELPNLRKLDALARLVADLVVSGHVVLVHCRMGYNRSHLVAATALTYLGMPGAQALAHLREVRPGALFNERFAEHVRGLPARRLRLEILEPSEGTAMRPVRRVRVKICCISSRDEARMAVEAGASALGLVSEMPSGPGVVSEETIAAIAREVPAGVASVLLTSRHDAEGIVAQQRRTRVNTLQLVDRLAPGVREALREALPGVGLVQVVHVTGAESVDEAVAVAREVDAILLDSGNPALAVKELGGTGRRHDWGISRRIREAVDVPVFLAGGLQPGNVREAIDVVGPFGLDVCTGVRTAGRLDPEKLSAFFAAI